MYELQHVTVADIKSGVPNALVGGPFGSNRVSRDYVDSGIPVIRGSNMGQGRWVVGLFAHVSRDKAAGYVPQTLAVSVWLMAAEWVAETAQASALQSR